MVDLSRSNGNRGSADAGEREQNGRDSASLRGSERHPDAYRRTGHRPLGDTDPRVSGAVVQLPPPDRGAGGGGLSRGGAGYAWVRPDQRAATDRRLHATAFRGRYRGGDTGSGRGGG